MLKKIFSITFIFSCFYISTASAVITPEVAQALKNARSNITYLPYAVQSYARQDLNAIEDALRNADAQCAQAQAQAAQPKKVDCVISKDSGGWVNLFKNGAKVELLGSSLNGSPEFFLDWANKNRVGQNRLCESVTYTEGYTGN